MKKSTRIRYIFAKLAVVMGVLISGQPASAGIIRMDFDLSTTLVVSAPDNNSPQLNDHFLLTMLVDNSNFGSDGVSIAGRVEAFNTKIGYTRFIKDGARDDNNAYQLLRGPCYNPSLNCSSADTPNWGLGSDSLGFEIVKGAIVGIWGGVAGPGDTRFIDFFGNTFAARTFNQVLGADPFNTPASFIRGDITLLSISAVPEPTTLILAMAGLLILPSFRRTQT